MIFLFPFGGTWTRSLEGNIFVFRYISIYTYIYIRIYTQMIFILDISNMDTTWQYCWWKKSCTSWYEEFLSIYRAFLHSRWFSRRISEPSIVANHQPFGFPLIDSNWLTNNLYGFSHAFPFFVNFHQQYFTTLSFFFLLACTSQLQRCLGSGEFIGLMSPTGKFCAEMTGPCDVVVVVVVVVSRFPFVVVAAVVLGCSELKHDKHIQKWYIIHWWVEPEYMSRSCNFSS